ncbi:DNA mismatch repair protein MutT [Pantoea sp. BL1]|uniref:NUDIX hydrolase n=1 Tax=Pantoea sp. BL1 TaxID=1628190 RepID=UPI0005F89401|nr:NUDIX domain-containing protein [Pantoea sp. BL1]KJV45535.1 DNA mismatch repair protein MutT [Pantoea sp. BL1]
MNTRPSARLLIIDPQQRVLLFCFTHKADALDGQRYWATPGGALENHESWKQAAIRELFEETGITRAQLDDPIGYRAFKMQLPSGEVVLAQEQYYTVQVIQQEISTAGWSQHEREVMSDYHWWKLEELICSGERYYPENLAALLEIAQQSAAR